MLAVAQVLLPVLGLLVVGMAILLVTLRLVLGWREERLRRRSSRMRTLFFGLLMGDEAEAASAGRTLDGLRGRQWGFAEDLAFDMLPKLRGAAREQLVSLLRERGAHHRAVLQTRSRSSVRRCRGAFGLGLVGTVDDVPGLVGLLGDKRFLVRRVAVRALGNVGSPDAVRPLLHDVRDNVRLVRDVLYALDRIGSAGAPILRKELSAAVGLSDTGHSSEVAATALGLIEDVAAVPALCRALRLGEESMSLVAAEALGRIGSPEAISSLTELLFGDSDSVRVAATKALGAMGSPLAIDSLLMLVEQDDPMTSRDGAAALRQLGKGGLEALAGSASPYAREALALQRLGSA